jgi:hypothetical protein
MGSRNHFSWYGAASGGGDSAYAPLEEVSRPRRARRIAVAAAAGALAALAIVVLCARESGESGRSFGEVLAQTMLGGGSDGATQWPQGSSPSRVKFLSEIRVSTFLCVAASTRFSSLSSSLASLPVSATPHSSDHQRHPATPLLPLLCNMLPSQEDKRTRKAPSNAKSTPKTQALNPVQSTRRAIYLTTFRVRSTSRSTRAPTFMSTRAASGLKTPRSPPTRLHPTALPDTPTPPDPKTQTPNTKAPPPKHSTPQHQTLSMDP